MEPFDASSRVWWSTAGTNRLLTIDYTGLGGPVMLSVLDEAHSAALVEPAPFMLLVDVTGASLTSDWLGTLKKQSRSVWQPRVTRCAVLGISGVKATMLRGINAVGGVRVMPFPAKEKALNWLAAGSL